MLDIIHVSKIPGYRESAAPAVADAVSPGSSGSVREVHWLVVVDGDIPLQVVVSSQKGGTHAADVSLDSSGS